MRLVWIKAGKNFNEKVRKMDKKDLEKMERDLLTVIKNKDKVPECYERIREAIGRAAAQCV